MAERNEFDIFDERLPTLRDFAREIPQSEPVLPASQSQISQLMRDASSSASSGARGLEGLSGLATAINRQRSAETRATERAATTADPLALVGQPAIGVSSWDQVRGGISGWDQLPYSEKLRAYDQYIKTASDRLKELNPRADATDLEFQLRERSPAPSEPQRQGWELLTDPLAGAGAGLIGLGGSLAAAATGGVPNPVSRALLGQAQSTRSALSAVEQDAILQRQFDNQQLQPQNRGVLGQFVGEGANALSNLSLGQIGELVGSTIPGLLTGGGVAALAGRAGLAQGAQVALGTGAGAAFEGASSAGDAGAQAYNTIQATPISELRQSPYWASAIEATSGDEAAARLNLAERGARLAAGVGGSAGVLLSILPGSLERSVSGAIARQATGGTLQPAARQGIGNFAAARAREAGVEGLTEASTSVAGNLGEASATGDFSASNLAQGAGGDFALGALAGGAIGTGIQLVPQLGGSQAQAVPAVPAVATGPQVPAVPAVATSPQVPGLQPSDTSIGPDEALVEGARLVRTADGRWAYADGEAANPVADDFLRGANELPSAVAPQPSAVAPQTSAVAPQPSAVAPQPSAVVPQPSAVVPQPSAIVPQPSAVVPQPSAVVPQPSAIVPQPSAIVPQPSAIVPQPGAVVPQPSAVVPQPGAVVPDPALPPAQPDPAAVPLPQELDSVEEQTQRLQNFSAALAEEMSTASESATRYLQDVSASLSQQLDGSIGAAEVATYASGLSATTAQMPEVAAAIERAAQRVGGLRPVAWERARGANALAAVINNTGLGITAAGNSQWAQAFRQNISNGDGATVLAAIATDPVLPATVRQGAQSVIDAYQASGIRWPQLSAMTQQNAAVSRGALISGSYSPSAHQVIASANASPSTLIHEHLHGLTALGLSRMRQRQPVQARNMDSLLSEIAAQARAAVPVAQRAGYALSDGVLQRGNTGYEMLAELFSPTYLDLMGRVQLNENALTPAARTALSTLQQPSDGTLRALFRRTIQKIMSYVTPRVPSERSLAQILADVAQPLTEQTRQSLEDSDAINSPPAPGQQPTAGLEVPQALRNAKPRYSYGNKQFILDFDSNLDKARFLVSGTRRTANYDIYMRWLQQQTGQTESALKVQGLRLRQNIKARAAAATTGGRLQVGGNLEQANSAIGNDQVLNSEDLLQPSNRDNYQDLIGDLQGGKPAEPATPVRGLIQSLRRGRGQERAAFATQALDAVAEAVHDSLTPFKRWVERMSDASERVKIDILSSLYAAPNIRDQQMGNGMKLYGGEQIQRIIGGIAGRNNMSTETAFKYAGYWLTARRAPSANTRLRQRAVDKVTEIQQQLQRTDLSEADLSSLQGQLGLAERDLGRITAAIYNPNANVAEHSVGVAGFSNAQANQVRQAVEKQIPRAQLNELAEQVSRLNGWRLTLDLQTGKVSPETAAEFIGKPNTQAQMEQFIAAHNAMDATQPATVAEYERQRDALIQAVRDDYVPLTGNPKNAGDDGFISSGTRQPNQARDYTMEGRTTSIPDHGLSASFASIIRSTSYAGWAPFQDSIARLYDSLSPEQRETVGIYRRTLGENATGLNEPGVVRRRGRNVQVYNFAEPGFIESIRGANVDGGGKLTEFFGKPIRWYSYLATQFNPFFAPRNYIRDGWERTELVRSRNISDANGNKVDADSVARQALANTFGPASVASIFKATSAYANGRRLNTNSREGAMLREFLDNGGASTWGDRFSPRRQEIIENIERFKGVARNARRGVAEFTDAYNRTFDMGPALGMYMALRDQNVTPSDAASLTLDQMNFRKRGALMALPRMLYAFAQTSVTGGANTLGSLYSAATGKVIRSGVTRLAGMSVAMIMLQSVLRGMAEDDEGGNRLDQMSEYERDNFLLLPVPGSQRVLKIPLAFGLPRIANNIALSAIGATTKEITPKEAGVRFAGNLIPVFSPLESVDIDASKRPAEWLMHTFAPSWLKGFVAIGTNRTNYDAPVVAFDDLQDMTKYRSEQFGYNTPEFYRDIARFVREYTGLDQAPEEVRALIKSIPMGAFSQALNGMVDTPFRREQGKDVPNPITGQYLTSYSPYGISAQFYDVLDDAQESRRKLSAGEKLTEDERKEIMWLNWWEKQTNLLKAEKARITRDKSLTEQAKERRREQTDDKRQRIQAQAVMIYRETKGLPVGRVD